MGTSEYRKIDIIKAGADFHKKKDNMLVPQEHVVTLVLNYQEILELTCLNENIEEFITGFLFTERIIDSINDIASIEFSGDFKKVFVITKDDSSGKDYRDKIKRVVTGCHGGLIQTQIDGVERPLVNKININLSLVYSCHRILEEESKGYRLTRCIHTACLFDTCGNLLFKCEDIGRHNAVDKLAGFAVKSEKITEPLFVYVTGRISSEMVSKILLTNWIGIFSISSATFDAVELCRKFNILLITRAKTKSLIICHQPENIMIEPD